MYCSSCGVAVKQGSSYCNYCGAQLSVTKAVSVVKSAEVRPESLLFSMMAVFVFGFGAITVLMGVMKAVLGFNVGLIVAFTLLSFLIMLVLESVFIRLLLQRKRGTAQAGDAALSKEQTTKELDAAQARVLPEPVPSVTENTTRTLEPVYNERTAK